MAIPSEPFQWLRINPSSGPLPPPSAVGPASPYFRFLPNSGIVGPNSAWPQQLALTAGPTAGSAPGQAASTLVRTAAANSTPMGELGTGLRALPAGTPVGPAAAAGGAGATARGLLGSAGATAAAEGGVPFFVQGAGGAAGAAEAAAPGLLRTALGAGGIARVPLRFGGIGGAAAGIAGNMLDESNLLGGQESAANDATSKVLKWGGLGATIGTVVPGVGTLLGAGVGGLVGLGHYGLEAAGVLGAPSKQEQIDTTIHTAEQTAANIGLPSQVVDQLKNVYNVQKQFVETKDEKLALAQQFADNIEQEATAFATDPASYLSQTTRTGQGGGPDQAKRQLLMQAVMTNTIKPYADNFLARAEAQAQSLENMAGSAGGQLAPMYQQMAAQTRMDGARYASDLIQQAQITPYQQAAEEQAAYLKQMSSGLVSQAMSQVMSGQQQTATQGTVDLTTLVDQATSQLQPQ